MKHKNLFSTVCLIIITLHVSPLSAQESELRYSADLISGTQFNWQVDITAFDYYVDGNQIDPTNILYANEGFRSGILFFPEEIVLPAEANQSIYTLTLNQDIDVVSSFDQLIVDFDYSLALDTITVPQEFDSIDVSKSLFNFFMRPGILDYENGSSISYFDSLTNGNSYQEGIDGQFEKVGFYPSRITSSISTVVGNSFFEIEGEADCTAASDHRQNCNSIESFYEFSKTVRVYDVSSGKLLSYSHSEDRTYDIADRLYPSKLQYNMTNIDDSTGSPPKATIDLPNDEFELDIPSEFVIGGIAVVGIFIAVLIGIKFSGREV